jgi:Uma2 family endonuclease
MILERKISLEQYLELEQRMELRHEFVDGELIEMPGTTLQHNDIINNISFALLKTARAKGCRLQTENIKLRVDAQKIRYPDVIISCQERQSDHIESAPSFLVEVLSRSTETTDYGAKVREYLALPSLQTYAIIAQNERLVVLYERRGEQWLYRALSEGDFEIPRLEMRLSLNSIYDNIVFEPQD